MATNTGKGFRRGTIRGRSQVRNPASGRWTLRGRRGRFVNVKSDGGPFKGVRRER